MGQLDQVGEQSLTLLLVPESQRRVRQLQCLGRHLRLGTVSFQSKVTGWYFAGKLECLGHSGSLAKSDLEADEVLVEPGSWVKVCYHLGRTSRPIGLVMVSM